MSNLITYDSQKNKKHLLEKKLDMKFTKKIYLDFPVRVVLMKISL